MKRKRDSPDPATMSMKRKRDSPDPATMSACADNGDSSSGAEFEVFLSFRGPDTRLNFTDCLYHSLVGAGIRVFRDDKEIRKGEKIGGELLRAIESSKIYVPIFSRNYASSVWCLRELTHIRKCSSKANDKVILPIFYDINPDDVKLKTQLYPDALEKHEEKFGRDNVWQWKEALTEVARIKGWRLKDKGHGEIINAILIKLKPPSSGCLVVNLRTDPLPSLLQSRDKILQAIYLRSERTIFGNLPERTDRSFVTQLSYIKKNNMDPLLLKSTPEAEESTPEAEESTPEAEDLRLLKKNPELRPEGKVFLHPYFWSSPVKLFFLCEFSDRLQLKNPAPNPDLLKELESNEPPVFDGNWIDKIDLNFKADILKRAPKSTEGIRRYTSSVEMLLRVVRNKYSHYWDVEEDIRKLLGRREEGLYSYFAARFPSLLMNSYRAASQYCCKEEWFKEFHRKTGLLLK